MGQIWQELFAESFRETMHGIAVFLPRIMVMLMLFVIGVLVGWLVKVLLLRVLRTLRLDAGAGAVDLRLHRRANPCAWLDHTVGAGAWDKAADQVAREDVVDDGLALRDVGSSHGHHEQRSDLIGVHAI